MRANAPKAKVAFGAFLTEGKPYLSLRIPSAQRYTLGF